MLVKDSPEAGKEQKEDVMFVLPFGYVLYHSASGPDKKPGKWIIKLIRLPCLIWKTVSGRESVEDHQP
jgi:hypothetical protein